MGKNSKRRKGTWTPHPITDGFETGAAASLMASDQDGLLSRDTKKDKSKFRNSKNEESHYYYSSSSSLKKSKKKNKVAANTPALRQLLGDSFPRTKRLLHFDYLHNDDDDDDGDEGEEEQERFADLSDIVATDWRAEARMPPELSDVDSRSSGVDDDRDDDEIYQSRKLVMRQLVMNQLSFIRQHFNPHEYQAEDDDAVDEDDRLDRDGVSDVDSWQEMEERFAEIYEPIPYDVAMDSWRSMTREQMLKTVTSRRLRSRMKYMSRAEILSQIQTLKSRHQKHNHRQSTLLQQSRNDNQQQRQQQQQRRQVGDEQRHKSQSPVYEDMSGTIQSPSVKQQSTTSFNNNNNNHHHQHHHHYHQSNNNNNSSHFNSGIDEGGGGGGIGHGDDGDGGVGGLGEPKSKKTKKKKKKKVQMTEPEQEQTAKSKFDSHVYQNTSAYQRLSLADIYQAKVEARRQELQLLKEQKASQTGHNVEQNGLYVTRALIHAPPGSDDENQQRFLSRSSILNKLGTPSTAPDTRSKSDLLAQFWRQSDYITTEYSRTSLNRTNNNQPTKTVPSTHSCSFSSPSSSCPSDCDACCDGGDACSMCSCSSCGSGSTIRSVRPVPTVTAKVERRIAEESPVEPDLTPEPIPLSLVKQRKMEFERLRVLEEQENRLQELVRRTRSETASPASQSWLDLAQRARQLEDKWNRARRSSSATTPANVIYEPVPASQLLKKEDKRKTKKRNSKKRSKVIQQLKSRMRENLAAESLDPRVRQRRHQELQELLSDAVHAGTQTLTNINLGLIYVPMEQQQLEREKKSGKIMTGPPGGGLMTLKTDRTQLGGSGNVASTTELVTNGSPSTDESEDVFGSIDTLIFEPKAGGSSTIKTDELDEVEERIAQQFEYLNDSQYGSCHEDSSDEGANSTTTGSKNGRRAAVAAVAAASPPPNPPAGPATGSCAAAASCDASASELTDRTSPVRDSKLTQHDRDSLASVTDRGQIMSDDFKERENGPARDKPVASTLERMDSEHYTNVDTDASWDYYPDGDGIDEDGPSIERVNLKRLNGEPHLAVGNLRKKPPRLNVDNSGTDEADETARLLESLRMAEDSNVSTSLRLIFPPSSSLKFSAAANNFFTDVANEALNGPSRSVQVDEPISLRPPSVQSPDSGFRSLPDMNLIQLADEKTNGPPTPPTPPTAAPQAAQTAGLRKRDTMIRELKMRLRDKFQCVGDDDDNHSTPPFCLSPPPHVPPVDWSGRRPDVGMTKKKTKVVTKLESILASFNALAQMKAEGRVYRTVIPQPLSLPAEYYTNDVDYQSSVGSSAAGDDGPVFQSTGYPHHLLQPASLMYQQVASQPATIYDPSLPDDLASGHYSEIPRPMDPIQIIHQQQMAPNLNPRLRGWYDNVLFDSAGRMEEHSSYPPENLYNVSEPLEERSHHNRKSRRSRRNSGQRRPTNEESTEEDEVVEQMVDTSARQQPIDAELSWSDIENELFAQGAASEDLLAAGHPARAGRGQSRMAPYRDEWLFWDQLHNCRWNEMDRQRWEDERARRMLLWIHHSQGSNASPLASSRPPQWWQVQHDP